MSDKFVKSDCKIDDHGNVKINLYDLIDNLNEEDADMIIEMFSWRDKVYKKVIENIRDTYAAPNYNDNIYKLRKAFFSMPIDEEFLYLDHSPLPNIIKMMKDTMEEIIRENATINTESYQKSQGWYAVKDWLRSQGFVDERIYELEKIYSSKIFPIKEDEKSYNLSRMMSKKIDIKDFVKNWCKEMYELFNEERQETQ